jgi:hypothetical protein
MKKTIIIILLAILIVVLGVAIALITVFPITSVKTDVENNTPVITGNPDISDAKTPPVDNTNDGQVIVQKNIIVESPQLNENITSPYIAIGKAKGWYFEGEFPVRLVDSNGKELAVGHAKAQTDWMVDSFVSFRAELIFNPGTAKTGKLIFEKSNPSDLREFDEKFEIPVKFAENNKIKVQAFFMNNLKDADRLDCTKLFSVEREILPTQAVGQRALEELLKGPTPAETQAGFATAISSGVQINKLTITNGVAKVDFTNALENNAGGSCKIATIRSQIEQTLKQFPTVTSVVISINGKTGDEILQP